MGKPVRLWVRTNDSFKVGDQVTVVLPSGSLAISALAMYGLPLLGLILGAVIGFQGGSEPQSLLAGGLGLILGLPAARQLGRKMQSEWQPTVLKKTHSTAININGVSE
jgi:sigma-E factor negative regulatory protein RseC